VTLHASGREIFVGISSRTNMLGAQAVARAFPEYSTTIVKVHPPAVHLKDYINVVHPEVLVVSKSPAAQKTFKVRNSPPRSLLSAAHEYLRYPWLSSMNYIYSVVYSGSCFLLISYCLCRGGCVFTLFVCLLAGSCNRCFYRIRRKDGIVGHGRTRLQRTQIMGDLLL